MAGCESHELKLLVPCRKGRTIKNQLWAAECFCGASSPLVRHELDALSWHASHKKQAEQRERLDDLYGVEVPF